MATPESHRYIPPSEYKELVRETDTNYFDRLLASAIEILERYQRLLDAISFKRKNSEIEIGNALDEEIGPDQANEDL